MDRYKTIANEVVKEADRALFQFGEYASMHEGYAVLLEEVEELWAEIKTDNIEAAELEAIQVAAVAMRIVDKARSK